MEIAKMTSKGQLTVPKAVRDKLNLEPGSKVVFQERGSEWVLTNLGGPAQDSPSPYRILSSSEKNRFVSELATRYDIKQADPEPINEQSGDERGKEAITALKRAQEAFEGFAEEMGWETEQDIIDFVKALRRGEFD